MSQLNWMDHQRYITETLLEKGDAASVTWLLQQEDKKEISKLLPSLKLSEKSANYWKMYFS